MDGLQYFLLACALLMTWWGFRRGRVRSGTEEPALPTSEPPREALAVVRKLHLDLEETSRTIEGRLRTQTVLLEQLLDEARQRTAELRQLLDQARRQASGEVGEPERASEEPVRHAA